MNRASVNTGRNSPMRRSTGPQMSPLTTACVAVSTETVSKCSKGPNRSRQTAGKVK